MSSIRSDVGATRAALAACALVPLLIALGACSGTQRPARTGEPATTPPQSRAAAAGNPEPVRATGAANPARSVESVEPWAFEDTTGRVIRTAGFSIYTTETKPIITDRLPGYLSAALDHYTTALGPLPRPATRMDSFIMATRQQWQRLTLRTLGPAAIPATYIERGGFATGGRAFLFDIGTADTFSIASHEGWHQFTQSTFAQRLPLCLEEGIASFMEGHRWIGEDVVFMGWGNTERFDQLRDSASNAGGLLPLESLFASSPGALMSRGPNGPLGFYAQTWALVHFLREGEDGAHAAGLRRLVSDAASGHMHIFVANALKLPRDSAGRPPTPTAAQVFQTYFDRNLSRLSAAFDSFQRRVVSTGGRDAVIEGRSPIGE